MNSLKIKSCLMLVATLMAAKSYAAGAQAYTCVGVNKANKKVIEINVAYDVYAPEVGFTNKSVTITNVGGKKLVKPIALQMYDANSSNHCKTNLYGCRKVWILVVSIKYPRSGF
jgi:hypothetical protein